MQYANPYVFLRMVTIGTKSFSQARAYFEGSDLIIVDVEGRNRSCWKLGTWEMVRTFDGMGHETACYLPRDAEANALREEAKAS